MRHNETMREIFKTILAIGMVPLVGGLLFLYVWLGEEVRSKSIQLESLKAKEVKLRGEYNLVQSERNRLSRPDHLAQLTRDKLGLVQPDPETQEIRVSLK